MKHHKRKSPTAGRALTANNETRLNLFSLKLAHTFKYFGK